MITRLRLASTVLLLPAVAGCATTATVTSLDTHVLPPDEGLLVVVLSAVDTDPAPGGASVERADPSQLRFAGTSSIWTSAFGSSFWDDDAHLFLDDGRPRVFARRLTAGEWWFNQVLWNAARPSGFTYDTVAARFEIRPGAITYVGHVQLDFLLRDDLRGVESVTISVSEDRTLARALLEAEYGPTAADVELRLDLVVIEDDGS